MANFQTNPPISLSTFRTQFYGGAGSVSLEGIRGTVYGNSTSLRSMQSMIGTSFWRYRLEISIPGAGFVQFTYPYASAQGNQVTSDWFWSANYNYMSIYCQPYYPYTFQYWRYGYAGAIFAYNLAPNVTFNATNELVLYAVVA